jgi:hypothetical protein
MAVVRRMPGGALDGRKGRLLPGRTRRRGVDDIGWAIEVVADE